MPSRLLAIILPLLCLLAATPAAARQQPHIAMELVAETTAPAPGGKAVLALVSRPEPGWHGYWLNPGDVGLPLTVEWTLPRGVRAGPLAFPVPRPLVIGGLMNHVYEGPFAHLVTLDIPADARPGGDLPIRAEVDYLVCSADTCIPESQSLETRLTIGGGGADQRRRAMFDRFRAAIPKPLDRSAQFASLRRTVRLAIPLGADVQLRDPHFFALTKDVVDYAAPQRITRTADTLIVELKTTAPVERLGGILALGDGTGYGLTAVPGAVPEAGDPIGGPAVAERPQASGPSGATLVPALAAFAGALLGGLFLNIMPCVFPILSLKALSLARAGGNERQTRTEALAYTAGAVLVVLALGGALLALRAGGASVGWAFQLQDPRVILGLLVLVTAIALNLAGLFELPTPRFANWGAGNGTGGAFATGALAAFIATPCTGPFMGAALGAALVLPWPAALAIFLGLGLGLALPFLLLGFIPALRRLLPRPGGWMATFRHILAVPMFATALALAWLLGRQVGVGGMTIGLGAALLLGLGLWWSGARQMRGRGWAWAPAAAALLLAGGAAGLIRHTPSEAHTRPGALDAEPFSEARLSDLRAEGRPVFAYFTADWCITCKVNEKAAIERSEVADAFRRANVAVLVGDWTNGDPALGRFIQQHNRAGVPLYLWYGSGGGDPRLLAQILTPQMLTALANDPRTDMPAL